MIQEYEIEEEMDRAFERIEELNFEHLSLKEAVEEAEKDLEQAQRRNFDLHQKTRSIHSTL